MGANARSFAWIALLVCAIAAGAWLRLRGIGSQIIIDDEWHALHKVLRADTLDIVTHLDYSDYSIPLALYFRWLYDTIGITEWGMHLPMLIAGIALIAVGPWLVRAWVSPAVGTTWAALLAVSPLLVYMSRTARPYAFTALSATIALVAFERWFRGDQRRDEWGATYVAATFAGGYLHMTSLAFTLMPFVYFGVHAWRRDRGELRRLLRMGAATGLPLAIVLLPPVMNDWFLFTLKAGADSVTMASSYRTLLMLAGSGHALVAALLVLCGVVGAARWWRRDRGLAGYVFACVGVGALAIMATRPHFVMHPLVFARYLVPALPMLLLLAAEGVVALMPARLGFVRAPLVALLAAAMWWFGPLPAQSLEPNQFTGHLRYQFDYDDMHNPYVRQAPSEPVPAFYRELAKRPPGSVTLIEAPWRLESHFNPHVWFQQVHRQRVLIGLTTPLCGTSNFGEYPESERGMRLANFVHLTALLRGQTFGADYLVLQMRPWSTPPGEDVPWPDMARCMPAIEAALGAPVFVDSRIVVFALRKGDAPKAH